MGKFMYALMMVVIVELGIWFFGGMAIAKSSLTDMILNPSSATSSIFYAGIVIVLIGAFTVSAIVPGNTFSWGVYGIYAVTTLAIVSFVGSLWHLASFINSNLAPLVSENILTASLTQLIIALLVGPLAIFYLISCLEWIRSNT